MKRTIGLIALFIIAAWPPTSNAQEASTYVFTAAPGSPIGYQTQVNRGDGVWVALNDSIPSTQLTFTYTQPVGRTDQVRVRGIWPGSTPIMNGELLIGSRYSRVYGPWSPLSVPYTVQPQAGACGRPVKQ